MDNRKESNAVKRILDKRPYNTKKCYWSALQKFFDVNDIRDPDEYIVDIRRMENDDKIDKLDQYEDDIRNFANEINNDYAPKTQISYLSGVKKFFMRNRIDFPQVLWDDINRNNHLRGATSIFEYRVPDADDLRKLLLYTDIKGKSLFTLGGTTGMRIDELLKLTFDNLFIEERKIRVIRNDAKGRYQRFAFFTDEAHELLVEWLRHRPQFLLTNYRKSVFVRKLLERQGYVISENDKGVYEIFKNQHKLSDDEIIGMDDRVFPFSYSVAKDMWYRMLENTGPPYNEKDCNPASRSPPRYKYNIHCLKRFFLTQMESVIRHKGSNSDMECIYGMVGQRSRLGRTYTPKTVENLKDAYRRYSDALAIFSDPEAKRLKPEIDKLKMQLLSITKDNLKMKNDEIETNLKIEMLNSSWFGTLSGGDREKYSNDELLVSYLFGGPPRQNP